MYAFVFVQITDVRKCLTTHITGTWTFPSMDTLMCLQITLGSKTLTTHITRKW